MLKRTLIIIVVTITMIIAVEPLQTAHGILMTEAELIALETSDAQPANSDGAQVQKFSGFKGVFKALGRLFGGGKKDKAKLQRISEKDMKKFESSPSTQQTRTNEVAAPPPHLSVNPAAPPADTQVTRDHAVTSASLHLEKGRTLLNDHDLNGAIAELSAALSIDPKSAEANSLLGVAYWRKGLRDRAQTSFEAAVDAAENDPQHLNNLGYLLYETGNYERATKYLKRAVKLAPDDARILNNLGLAQAERGKYDDAYKSFERALGEYRAHINLAARLERHGRNERAIKHLEKARALQPNSPDVLARLVFLYEREERSEKAESARTALTTLRMQADAIAK